MVKRSMTKVVINLLAIPALVACSSGTDELAGGVKRESVAAGGNEQAINGPFSFGREWTTITFDAPLEVDAKTVQVLGVALNPKEFQPLTLAADEESERQGLSDKTPFGIKGWLPERLKDGKTIEPEVELITTDGEKVQVGVLGITEFGRGSYSPVSYNFGVLPESVGQSSNYQANFPEEHRYEAVRIRTNEPLEAYFLAWYTMPTDPRSEE